MTTKGKIIIGIPILAALLWGATSGNIQWTQLASGSRHGSTGTKGQSSDGTGTSGNCAKFDASGNLTDAGAACGTASSGTAGGDLSGTYPNPTVAQVNGAVVPASAGGVKTNSSRQLIAQLAADVVGLFSGCSGTMYLGADGACHAAASGGFTPVGTPTCTNCTSSTGLVVQTGASASTTFGSISGSFTNLELIVCGRTSDSTTAVNLLVAFNGDGATNYNREQISFSGNTIGNPQSQSGITPQFGALAGNTATANRQGCTSGKILGYSGTTFHKMAVVQAGFDSGASGTQIFLNTLQWLNTAAITSLVITDGSGGNFSTGTIFTLNAW